MQKCVGFFSLFIVKIHSMSSIKFLVILIFAAIASLSYAQEADTLESNSISTLEFISLDAYTGLGISANYSIKNRISLDLGIGLFPGLTIGSNYYFNPRKPFGNNFYGGIRFKTYTETFLLKGGSTNFMGNWVKGIGILAGWEHLSRKRFVFQGEFLIIGNVFIPNNEDFQHFYDEVNPIKVYLVLKFGRKEKINAN